MFQIIFALSFRKLIPFYIYFRMQCESFVASKPSRDQTLPSHIYLQFLSGITQILVDTFIELIRWLEPRENDQKQECAQNIHQRHNCARPK